MVDLYERKNADYGDSFAVLYGRFGLQSNRHPSMGQAVAAGAIGARPTLWSATNRVDDTLIDIANYCSNDVGGAQI